MKYLLLGLLLVITTVVYTQDLLEYVPFADGLNVPVEIENAGDSMLYVIEKQGRIRLISPDGSVLARPFLNIQGRVNNNGGERGLLGMDFHPAFPDSPYVYVNYTGNNQGETVISRFTIDENDNEIADPNSELIILTIDQPFSNHNGGDLLFGPDGYLYIPTGDGGSGGDPLGAGQDRMSNLGKILRIDVDNGNPYTIPDDNPFAHDDFTNDEIWALGLRNPWRIDFDPITGDLYIADVGQNSYEEIDFQPASSQGGENYGWRCFEGDSIFNLTDCDEPNYVFPVHAYEFPLQDCASITGGVVYYGTDNPGLYGKYLFADFCTGMFATLYKNDAEEWICDTLLDQHFLSITTFGRDATGEVYVASIGGSIFKLHDKSSSVKDIDHSIRFIRSNPVLDYLEIDESVTFEEGYIYSSQGKQMLAIRANRHKVDVSSLSPGMYYVLIAKEGRLYSDKVLVLH